MTGATARGVEERLLLMNGYSAGRVNWVELLLRFKVDDIRAIVHQFCGLLDGVE